MTTNAISYPVFMKSKDSNMIVRFTDLREGKVVVLGKNKLYNLGEIKYNWMPHTDEDTWVLVDYDESNGVVDKQLVECWNSDLECTRTLCFYDKLNKSTYTPQGTRNGVKYNHYKPVSLNGYPKWAKDVVLED